MTLLKRYFAPACITVLLLGAVFWIGDAFGKRHPKSAVNRDIREEIIQLPHGRALYVVVEDDGIYVGEEFVPFLLFDKYLRDNATLC